MKTRFSLIILFIAFVLHMQAQSFMLHGTVLDSSGKPLEFATISSQGKVTFSSLKGTFSLTLQSADSVVVKFSSIGFKTKTRILRKPKGTQKLMITLTESQNTLGTIDVSGQKIQTGQNQQLKQEDLDNVRAANGNSVEKLVQLQAGVSTHNELSSQYNVRGGAFDENSVYINGNEVYRPYLVRSGQQEGLSVINPYMVDKIDFSTGGFAAKYGDKMSSALDIIYKKPKDFEAKISASLMSADAYVGIGNSKFSWSNSIRYKSTHNLLGTLETTGEYKPRFMDYQTYLSYTPNDRWTIDVIGNINLNNYNFLPVSRETSFGTSQNVKSFRVYFDGQEKDVFKTYYVSASITRHLGKNTRLSLNGAAFSTHEKEQYDIQGQYWLTQTETSENLGVGTYFEHARNYLNANVGTLKLMLQHRANKHQVEAAASLKKEHIEERSSEYEMRDSSGYNIPHNPQILNLIYSLRAQNTINATRIEGYIQDTWNFTSKGEHTHFTLNMGLRMSHWSFNQETIVSPRLSLGIIPAFNSNVTFRLATGLYYQAPFFKELLDTTTTNHITTAKLNEKIRSQRSIHFIAGFDYRFFVGKRPFKFTAEAYYKMLSNLIPYSINNVKVIYYGANDAKGHAAGIDFKLYGEFVPNTNSWISLSLMNTSMQHHGINMPLPTDQRYAFNMFFTDYFPGTERWKLSLAMTFADGLPFSTPHNELKRSAFRAPAYKRVDLGMSYRLIDNTKKTSAVVKNIWLGIECLNLFGISNVNSYHWITDVRNVQYAVPNYLTGRQLNTRITIDL